MALLLVIGFVSGTLESELPVAQIVFILCFGQKFVFFILLCVLASILNFLSSH
jgi:hypothetical protein